MTLAAPIASANSASLIISRKMIMVKVPCLSSQEAIKIECHNLVEEKASRGCDNSGNGC
jgi:hypothetical protein